MAKNSISTSDLSEAIGEMLSLYREDIQEQINEAGERAAKRLVKLTKSNAPKRSGDFAKSITYKVVDKPLGAKAFVWGAKAPHHRVTHLLVHGHAKQNGGRVSGDPFLEDALEIVLPEYEKEVEEAVKG